MGVARGGHWGAIALPESKIDRATKRHFWPQNAFLDCVQNTFAVSPSGLCPEPRWGSLQRSPDFLAGGRRLAAPPKNPLPLSAYGLEARPFRPQECPPT